MVRPPCFLGDDSALAAALKADKSGAMEVFYHRYARYVQRILASIVNVDMDLAELLQEVFVQAFSSVGSLRDESRLKSWLTGIAVNTARKHINKNARWFLFPKDYPDVEWPVTDVSYEDREAVRYTYAILERMPVNERVAFSLRFIEEMNLEETAEACQVSLATIKRRLAKARKRFLTLAVNCPILHEWIERGSRWEVKL